MDSALKIGFIGLGNMGMAMAGRLLAAGHSVTVYNRTESKSEELADKGAKIAKQPSDLGDSDFVITMLADDYAVDEVVNGPQGFAKTLKAGATHLAMSTISVELSQRLADQHARAGQKYVAAPVLGRPDAAEAGKLFIFAAGDVSPWVSAVFTALSQKVFPIQGDAWRAHLVKLACNFMLASAIETMSEAFALTRKAGIEAEDFFVMFSSTLFSAPVYKNYGSMIAAQNYNPDAGFKLPLAAKDLRLVLEAANDLKVPMPTASTVRDQMMQAIGRGHENLDWSVLGKVAADNAGIK